MILSLYIFILLLMIYLGFQFYWRKNWIALICVLSFAVRGIVCIFFLTDYQYTFVLDSLGYEYNAWEIAKSWGGAADYTQSAVAEELKNMNLYVYFLASIFFLFGKKVLLGMLANSFFGALTIYFVSRMASVLFDQATGLVVAVLLTFYPSFVIWSSTNIRDPIYFLACASFFYYFIMCISKKSTWTFDKKSIGFVMIILSFLLIVGIRFYIAVYFAGSLTAGLLFYKLSRWFGYTKAVLFLVVTLLVGAWSLSVLAPEFTATNLDILGSVRRSFSNLGYDDVAQSSFALDYEFNTVWDVILFIPMGLTYYFFGPFPWDIKSFLQALSQIEVFLVYILVYPTLVGLKKSFKDLAFETSTLFVFCIFMAILQCLTISNLGTLFRHRTLGFIFLSVFAGYGIRELKKKYKIQKVVGFVWN